MNECNETGCYEWQDKRNMQNMWKPMHARGSQQIEKLSSSYRAEANLHGSNNYQASIEQIESVSMDRESVEKLSRQSPKSLMDWDCVNFYRDKKKEGLDR